MVIGRKTLHLAGSNRDFGRANRLVRESPDAVRTEHWILTTEQPETGFSAASLVEWIRIPDLEAGSGESWLDDLSRVVDTFSPERVVIHRDFAERWFDRIQDILIRMPRASATILGPMPAATGADTEEDR